MTFPSFGIWRRKRPVVIDHQFQLIDGFECSTEDFYHAIERDLTQREVPAMELSRIEFAEGGMLSARREYLRMRRERLVFDVCSAPFGKSWFFSYRFSEIPATLLLWELLVVLAALAGLVLGYVALFGLLWGAVIIGLTLLGLGLLLHHSQTLGLYGLDDFLLRLPCLGAVYEVLLRKETYYREDTRLMYVTLVREIIENQVQEVTVAKGVRQTGFVRASPDIGERLAVLLRQAKGGTPVPTGGSSDELA